MNQIRYRASRWAGVRPVEIVRETKHMIVLPGGSRVKKESGGDRYFETEADAYQWLVETYERRVENARKRLAWDEESLAEYRAALKKALGEANQ